MVLPGTTFSQLVQKRFPVYETVYDTTIDPNLPPTTQFIDKTKYSSTKKQSVPIPGSEAPGYSHVYRNEYSPDKLITAPHPSIQTVKDFLETSVHVYPDLPCLGERHYDRNTKKWLPFEFQSVSQVRERVVNLASGLIQVVEENTDGLTPHKEQYNVGLYGPNSRNWLISDLACAYTSLSTVALYDTFGPKSTEYIIKLTEMPVLFVSLAHIPSLLAIKDKLPFLKIIISLNELEIRDDYERPGHSKRDLLSSWAQQVGVKLYDIYDLEELGKNKPQVLKDPRPEDVFTINFTSGTTGNHPKGVILTHQNVVAGSTKSLFRDTNDDPETIEQQYYLSFLPLAHIYERFNLHSFIFKCFAIGFIHGDVVTTLFDDIKSLRPHFICGVPRIWNKLAAQIRTNTIEAQGPLGKVSRQAFNEKLAHLKETGSPRHPKWDPAWSNKLRSQLGFDRTVTIASGAAPIATENIEFLMCSLAVDLVQGYGLTETCSGFATSKKGDSTPGSNGPVGPNSEIRLRDLPDLGYRVSDKPCPQGEIMIRGPQVFRGYYKNEEETIKAFDEEGWFHTGDVGRIDEMGRLFVIDRVKNMFKLAQGEYVAPEKIESLYQSSSSLISQIFIDGSSLEKYLVAIIGVNLETYLGFLQKVFFINISANDIDEIKKTFSRSDIRKAYLQQINLDIKDTGLKGFEKAKNMALFLEPLSTENGTLTPTLKLRRIPARKYFLKTIEQLYQEGVITTEDEPKSRL